MQRVVRPQIAQERHVPGWRGRRRGVPHGVVSFPTQHGAPQLAHGLARARVALVHDPLPAVAAHGPRLAQRQHRVQHVPERKRVGAVRRAGGVCRAGRAERRPRAVRGPKRVALVEVGEQERGDLVVEPAQPEAALGVELLLHGERGERLRHVPRRQVCRQAHRRPLRARGRRGEGRGRGAAAGRDVAVRPRPREAAHLPRAVRRVQDAVGVQVEVRVAQRVDVRHALGHVAQYAHPRGPRPQRAHRRARGALFAERGEEVCQRAQRHRLDDHEAAHGVRGVPGAHRAERWKAAAVVAVLATLFVAVLVLALVAAARAPGRLQRATAGTQRHDEAR